MMTAILICGTMVFTACSMEDNPAGGTGASGIAMIVKNGQIDYWRQNGDGSTFEQTVEWERVES